MKQHHFSIIWQRFNYFQLLDTLILEDICVLSSWLCRYDVLFCLKTNLFLQRSIIENLPFSFIREALSIFFMYFLIYFLFFSRLQWTPRRKLVHIHAGSNRTKGRPCIMYNTSRYWFPQWFHPSLVLSCTAARHGTA